MAQKHSDVERSRAIVAELDQLILRLKSRINTHVLTENAEDEENPLLVSHVNHFIQEQSSLTPQFKLAN